MAKQIVIVGGGFAGVWAALGAAAQAKRDGASAAVRITLHSPSEHLVIRPRLYENDLAGVLVPLRDVLGPVRVRHVQEQVTDLGALEFDELILCPGSHRAAPLSAATDHGVDSYEEARALRHALAARLHEGEPGHARPTVAVIGAGFTGIEVAAELASSADVRLADTAPTIAPEFGPKARAVIKATLAELGVTLHTGASAAGARDGAELTIWTTGMRANPLAEQLKVPLDGHGRVFVDRSLHTELDGIWAAGDIARVTVDGTHDAVMSCQQAMPQGAVAGANAVRAALGKELKPYEQPMYLTCLDLGAGGALLTCGFERDDVLATGPGAKTFKRWINRTLIYPPPSRREGVLLKLGSTPSPGARAAKLQQRALRYRLVRRQLTATAKDHAAAYAARQAGPGLAGPGPAPEA